MTVEDSCMATLISMHTGEGRLHPTRGWRLDTDRRCLTPFAYNDWAGYGDPWLVGAQRRIGWATIEMRDRQNETLRKRREGIV